MSSQEPVSVPHVVRPRRHGWGDMTARREMTELADHVRRLAGFGVCGIEVLRSDDMLEFVALASDDPLMLSEYDGASSPLSAMYPALDQGLAVGGLRFVRFEDMSPEAFERLRPYLIFPDVEPSADPTRWHAEDMLVALVGDEHETLRALVYLDSPLDGRRPTPEQIAALGESLRPSLHAVLVQIEREEFAQRIRLASATRAVIRSAASQTDVAELVRLVREECRAPFRAQEVWIEAIDTFDGDAVREPGFDLGPEARAATKSALVNAWRRQTVLIIEPDHVWGDEELDRDFREELSARVTARGLREVVVVPVGAGPDALGLLAVARDLDAPRWTDDESVAALDVAHDLGRAILNARASERERAAVVELHRLDHYRQTLIDTVARELANPLALVSGHLELLEGMDLPDDARRSVAPMVRNAARLTTLAHDLSLLSRVADAARPIGTATLDLAELVSEAIAAMVPRAEQREVSITLSVAGNGAVRGHPLELAKCLGALLDNAVKFSRRGGRVEVDVRAVDSSVTVTVRDQGIGISSTDQTLVFGEFFRSNDPAARNRSGYGLGLSIVRQVVLRHGGSISIESARGEGATFRVVLPGTEKDTLVTTW